MCMNVYCDVIQFCCIICFLLRVSDTKVWRLLGQVTGITGSTHSSREHRQHVGDFGSVTCIISIQTAFFFQLPTPTCQSCSDFSHCPSALNSRSQLRPYPPCHHWLVGSVTWQFKVPTAYSNVSHSHGHWNQPRGA